MSDILGIAGLLLLGMVALYFAEGRPPLRHRDQLDVALTALRMVNALGPMHHAGKGAEDAEDAADHVTFLGAAHLSDREVTQELLTGVPRPWSRVATGLPSGPTSPAAVTPPSPATGGIQRHLRAVSP